MKKYDIFFVAFLAVFISAHSLYGQLVERKINNFILIDTDKNVGVPQDTVYIMRMVNEKKAEVGVAVIVKVKNGKTAAHLKAGDARVGDIISRLSMKQMQAMRNSFNTDSEEYVQIIRKYNGYVLIGPNSPFNKKNKILIVKRKSEFGLVDVGSVKIVKIQNGNTAAKIINEISPYHIEKGDVVLGKQVTSDRNVIDVLSGDLDEDIDYYFFGPYNPQK